MITRRTLLYAGAATLASPAIVRHGFARSDTVPIGVICSLSGVFANVGEGVEVGARVGYEYFREAAGKRIEYILLDDQGDPGRAVRLVQDAFHQRGVRHFVGTTNSAIALAVAKEVHALGGVNVNLAGADEMTGTQCNKASFRWPVATYSAANATVRPFMAHFPDAKRFYTITGDYVFGESLLRNTVKIVQELGGEHVGNSYHSLSEREYSGYITAAIAAEPDVLAICNFGNQTLDVVRQAVSFGMKSNTKILAVWTTGLDQFQAWGSDILEGIYVGANYWHNVGSPGNRVFRKEFEAKHKRVPNYLNATGWAVMQIMVEGMNKAGSTHVGDTIAALEGLEYEGVTGRESIRAGDHQVVKPYYFMVGKPASQITNDNDFIDILSSEIILPPLEETGCKMT